jgi:hypothetical protein
VQRLKSIGNQALIGYIRAFAEIIMRQLDQAMQEPSSRSSMAVPSAYEELI